MCFFGKRSVKRRVSMIYFLSESREKSLKTLGGEFPFVSKAIYLFLLLGIQILR
jgi:hypothetical protein